MYQLSEWRRRHAHSSYVTVQHVRDIIQKKPKTELTYLWRWRPELPLGNGLEEGPDGPRTLDKQKRATPDDLRHAGWYTESSL